MSFTAVAWATQVKAQTPTQKLVLIMISSMANEDGFCWPSMQSIANSCELSRSCVLETVKKLAALGFIQVEKRTVEMEEGGRRNTSHLYRVCIGEYPLGMNGSRFSIVANDDNGKSTNVVQDYKGSRPERQGVVVQNDNRTSNLESVNETINTSPLSSSTETQTSAEKSLLEAHPLPPPAKSSASLEEVINSFQLTTQRRKVLDEWLEYKREKKQGYKPSGLKALLKQWADKSDSEFEQAVNSSMAANYSGIFPPKGYGKSTYSLPEEF